MTTSMFVGVLCASLVTIVLTLPAFVVAIQSLFGLMEGEPPRTNARVDTPSTVVLVPAHNEAAGIERTLASIRSGMHPAQRILVVADNCDDETAALARGAGAEVIERSDEFDIGKGFALSFGIEHLREDPPEVVIIVDADCTLSEAAMFMLAREAKRTEAPVQAEYIFEGKDTDGRGAVSALATLVKNRARPRGMSNLGLPVHLMGTGMAFPWQVLADCPPMGGYLVEDILMGIELARQGHLTSLYTAVEVRSSLPDDPDAAASQRQRWEHGHLRTLFTEGPKLLWQGLRQARPGLFALGGDLMVPPLSLYGLVLGVTLIAAYWFGARYGAWQPMTIATVATLALVGAVLGVWRRWGRPQISGKALLKTPWYVLAKVPMYAGYFLGRGQQIWKRTERDEPIAESLPPDDEPLS